jgi:hypothetical protein
VILLSLEAELFEGGEKVECPSRTPYVHAGADVYAQKLCEVALSGGRGLFRTPMTPQSSENEGEHEVRNSRGRRVRTPVGRAVGRS